MEFPAKIKELDELKPGTRVLVRDLFSRDPEVLEVVEAPFKRGEGWYVKVRPIRPGGVVMQEEILDLATVGVVPYPDGRWETHRYLQKLDK